MLVTLFGIVTEVKLLQSLKAPLPMLVISWPIIISVTNSSNISFMPYPSSNVKSREET